MRFLLRNWHLKLSAVLLATVLYTGLVFSGSLAEQSIQLAIETTGQPGDSFVLSGTPGTVEVLYRVPNDSPPLSTSSFRAVVDLSDYDMERAPEPQVLPVEVTALVDNVVIASRDPATVTVQLDRLGEKTVPVEVETGEVPEDLEIDEPEVSVEEVQVRGAASLVERVDRAVARVLVDESGIDIDRSVSLELVDITGQPVEGVEADPPTVRVQVDVQAVETTSTVPVRPQIESGAPAPGYALEALSVEPSTVTLRGLPEVLAEISEVVTEPLSISGLSEDQTFEAELVLPDGARMANGDDAFVSVTATIGPSVSSRTFVLGIVCQGAGDNACLPGLDQLTVTLEGPGQVLSTLTAADLTPILDVTGLSPGSYTLNPSVAGLPDGVELLQITPTAVPVVVEAPAVPTAEPTPEP